MYVTSKIILLTFYTVYLQEERARKAANRKARIAADLDAVESDQVIMLSYHRMVSSKVQLSQKVCVDWVKGSVGF